MIWKTGMVLLSVQVGVRAPLVAWQSDAAAELRVSPMRACVRACVSSVVVFIRLRPGLLPLLPCTGKCLHASAAVFKWPAWTKNPSAGMKHSQGGADEREASGEGLEGSQHGGRQEAAVICLLAVARDHIPSFTDPIANPCHCMISSYGG